MFLDCLSGAYTFWTELSPNTGILVAWALNLAGTSERVSECLRGGGYLHKPREYLGMAPMANIQAQSMYAFGWFLQRPVAWHPTPFFVVVP